MDLTAIRRHVIAAICADEHLRQRLVLKGGNAIDLVHGIAARGSVDLDFSISGEFEDVADTGTRIESRLRSGFATLGITVFDYRFEIVPPPLTHDPAPWWGGYRATFKLIDTVRMEELAGNLAAMQRESVPIDTRQRRVFRVDISKHEYCEGKAMGEVEGVCVYVYTEEMLVMEKLRAICQQMPGYSPAEGRLNRTPRARDFYDIYTLVTARGLDLRLPENIALCRRIFDAKRVPTSLLLRVETTREFHRLDWDAVLSAATGRPRPFDFYFDFVRDLVNDLIASGVAREPRA